MQNFAIIIINTCKIQNGIICRNLPLTLIPGGIVVFTRRPKFGECKSGIIYFKSARFRSSFTRMVLVTAAWLRQPCENRE